MNNKVAAFTESEKSSIINAFVSWLPVGDRAQGDDIKHWAYSNTIVTSNKHDKQSQSLANVNVNVIPPEVRVRLRDCSMFCIERMLGFIKGNCNGNVNIKIYKSVILYKLVA